MQLLFLILLKKKKNLNCCVATSITWLKDEFRFKTTYLRSTFWTDGVGTLKDSFFGFIGHQVPSCWNWISSLSEQSFRISKNNLKEEKKTRK